MLLLPAIDLKDGQCVRLRQGKMEETTVFSDSPVDTATRWVEAGAKRLHLVDLNGAFIVYTDISRDGMMTGVNVEATEELAKSINIPVIASGGVTDMNDIIELCKVEGNGRADGSGITGTILGRSIYEGTIDLAKAHEYVESLV